MSHAHPLESPASPPEVQLIAPGDILEFGTMDELVEFEDQLAAYVDPKHLFDNWAGRVSLKEILTLPNFYGRLVDIELELMEDAAGQLNTAKERGLKFVPKMGIRQGDSTHERPEPLGFRFRADLKSSNPGIRGQISSELYYAPLARDHKKKADGTPMPTLSDRTGQGIRRIITRPQYDRQSFERSQTAAKSVGRTVLKERMRGAVLLPFGGRVA